MEGKTSTLITELNSAYAAATKPADVYEESQMLLAKQVDWGNFIEPAPMTVAILGEIMLVSTKQDFKLDTPQGGWKYSKWGNFRPCLLQIAHEATAAFRVAQTNMEAINMLTSIIPDRAKEAVVAISQQEVGKDEVKDVVGAILGQIANQSEECVKKSAEIVEAFDSVIHLIDEVQESCMQTKGTKEEQLRQAEISLIIKNKMKVTLEETKKAAEEQYSTMKDSFDKAQKTFEHAADNMPSGWELLGMSVVNSLTSTLSNAVSSYMNMSNPVMFGMNMLQEGMGSLNGGALGEILGGLGVGGGSRGKAAPSTEELQQLSENDRKEAPALHKAEEVLTSIQNLAAMYGESKIDWNAVKEAREGAGFLKAFLEALATQFADLQASSASRTGKTICDQGSGLAKVLADAAERLNQEEEKLVEGRQSTQKLLREAQSFAAKAKMVSGGSTLPRQGLATPSVQEGGSKHAGDDKLVQGIIENSQYQLTLATQELDRARDGYNEACKVRLEAAEKLGSVMAEIAGLDLQKIDFEKIKEVLRRAISMLAELRKQWNCLTLFFLSINNLIKVAQKQAIDNFLLYADKGKNLGGVSMAKFILNQIYLSTFEVTKVAHLVSLISGTYGA